MVVSVRVIKQRLGLQTFYILTSVKIVFGNSSLIFFVILDLIFGNNYDHNYNDYGYMFFIFLEI